MVLAALTVPAYRVAGWAMLLGLCTIDVAFRKAASSGLLSHDRGGNGEKGSGEDAEETHFD